MKFRKNGMVFVEETIIKRDGKKDLEFIMIADPVTYENESFFKSDKMVDEFKKGEKIDVEIEKKGQYVNINCMKAK